MDVQANSGWTDRLGTTARVTLIVVASILGVFAIGMIAGFSHSVIEHGHLPTKPLAYAAFAAMVGLLAFTGWVLATLFASFRRQKMSGFDRRYWKMWAVIVGLSVALGTGLAAFGQGEAGGGVTDFLSTDPIAPMTAIVGSIAMIVVLGFTVVYYHRTVDDHEERAYLWGSTLAYYFLMLAFPLQWLLARGGLVPTLTFGSALLIILSSCVVQALVWALFKFR